MNKMGKCIFQWLSLLVLLLIFLAFSGCFKVALYKYNVTAVQLYNVDNSDSLPVNATTGIVNAKAYAIQMQFTSKVNESITNDADESRFSLSSRVNQFNIYSLSDFDNNHPAGASLNDYFLYGQDNGAGTVLVSASDSITNVLNEGRFFLTYGNFNNTNTSWSSSAYLLLMQSPAFLGYRTFIVNVVFADNTQFKDSISVTLK